MTPAACERPVDDLADGVIVLPTALHEVSGIAVVDDRTLACVQDELGAVFLVDLRGEREVRVVPFGSDGDYEGIAFVAGAYWVLRSDGLLLELQPRADDLTVASTYRLPADCEYEGLCHDAIGARLLALPKGAVSDRKKERRRRRAYAFDLTARVAVAEPVVTVRLDRLLEQATERGLEVPTRVTKKGNERLDLELRCSEIAVAPDGSLLLLSSADHMLIGVDRDGRLVRTARLDPARWPQPEAMTFLPDGRLLVASEGVRGPAVIAVSDWK